jgi:peptidoglycan/xylan/chitin deacetylase (PgdA/CDA1 family)
VPRRSWPALACSIALAATLAACGGGTSSPSTSTKADGKQSGGKTTTAAAAAKRQASRAPALKTGSYHGSVPILMYHVVSTPTPDAPYPELWTPRAAFAAQMDGLARAGYQAVTLQQAFTAWHGGAGLPPRPFVASFDDGYLSQLTNAAPVLFRHGWRGVLNLEVRNVRPGDLASGQVKQLIGLGWEIDAHTLTHPDLTTVDATRLADEVGGSRTTLKRMFGIPVSFFAYPAGRFDAAAQAAVRAAGYSGAVTTQPGIASARDDPTILPRVRVDGNTSPATLLSELGGGSLPTAGAGG